MCSIWVIQLSNDTHSTQDLFLARQRNDEQTTVAEVAANGERGAGAGQDSPKLTEVLYSIRTAERVCDGPAGLCSPGIHVLEV